MKTVDLTHKLYIDQTGHFPVTSSKGHKNTMIVCDHDSNTILSRPLKKLALEQLRNIQEMHKFLINRGIRPKTRIMDNECPKIFREHMLHIKNM